jgi:predicted LPLAT superfamily acyltransferase
VEQIEGTDKRQWSGKTDGNAWMQRSLIYIYRVMDLRFLYFPMAVVIPFYMLLNRQGYLSIYHFFRKRMCEKPLRAFWHVYRNHFAFGQVILDRFASYAGKKFQLDIENYDTFKKYANDTKGLMILTAHVGNYEVAGYSLISKGKRFNTLIFSGETDTVLENRKRMLSKNNIRLIGVKKDMSHLFTMSSALSDGEIMSMTADRIFGSPKSIRCRFLGEEAKFPIGPFALAVQREVPILTVFVMKESVKRYRVFIRPIELNEVEQALSNKEKIQISAERYAEQLEETIKQYPIQWFNYFEFWNQ